MALIRETDYGTPSRVAEALVTLEIDGKTVTVPAGTSVIRAAVNVGVQIPKLCATDSIEPFGTCRLCLVEVEGRRGTPASCTTLVEPGMKVRTSSPKLSKLRRGMMELYISDHPLDCLTCGANTHPSEIMDEIARLTPSFAGVSFGRIDELGSVQWPCNDQAPKVPQ